MAAYYSSSGASASAPAMPQFTDLQSLLAKPTSYSNHEGTLACGMFSSEDASARLRICKVLVIGAGGLGSEHLKNLALSGVKNIHVIDMDTIDLTNLNRQFLFRMKDVGRGKAETAAEFVMNRVPGCTITPHNKMIQEMDDDFYRQFTIIIAGLDNVKARRWMNKKLHEMVQRFSPGAVDEDGNDIGGAIKVETVIPMIDGGTEAFDGQCNVFIPFCGPQCFECSTGLFPPQTSFQLCTLASKPRVAEHCIAWVTQIHWDEANPFGKGSSPDYDNADHVQWIYEKALARAQQFGIEGVTYFKTLGVAKNIIPAVASTNAAISALCCTEALKYLTFRGHTLNNGMQVYGVEGFHAEPQSFRPVSGCIVCGVPDTYSLDLPANATVMDFIGALQDHPKLQLSKDTDKATGCPTKISVMYKMIYKWGNAFKDSHANLKLPLRNWADASNQVAGASTYQFNVFDLDVSLNELQVQVTFV